MFDLKKILGEGIKKKGLGKSIQAALVCEDVEKAIQERLPAAIADKVKVVSLKNYAVSIKTSSSVIAQELKLREADILQQLNDKFGAGVVKNLRYLN